MRKSSVAYLLNLVKCTAECLRLWIGQIAAILAQTASSGDLDAVSPEDSPCYLHIQSTHSIEFIDLPEEIMQEIADLD